MKRGHSVNHSSLSQMHYLHHGPGVEIIVAQIKSWDSMFAQVLALLLSQQQNPAKHLRQRRNECSVGSSQVKSHEQLVSTDGCDCRWGRGGYSLNSNKRNCTLAFLLLLKSNGIYLIELILQSAFLNWIPCPPRPSPPPSPPHEQSMQCIDFCIMMISCSPDDQQLVCVNVHIKTCSCSTSRLLLCNSLGTGPVSPADVNRGRFAKKSIPKHMLIDCHFLDCPANILYSLDRCCCCSHNPDPV